MLFNLGSDIRADNFNSTSGVARFIRRPGFIKSNVFNKGYDNKSMAVGEPGDAVVNHALISNGTYNKNNTEADKSGDSVVNIMKHEPKNIKVNEVLVGNGTINKNDAGADPSNGSVVNTLKHESKNVEVNKVFVRNGTQVNNSMEADKPNDSVVSTIKQESKGLKVNDVMVSNGTQVNNSTKTGEPGEYCSLMETPTGCDLLLAQIVFQITLAIYYITTLISSHVCESPEMLRSLSNVFGK